MNTTDITVRGNTINNSCGGVYISSLTARTISHDIIDNHVTVAAGASGAMRNAVRGSADTPGFISRR